MKTFKQFLEEAYKLPGQRVAFRTAYHGTSVPNARSISRSGFKPGTRFDQDKPIPSGERIYVTTDKEKAKVYANQAGPEKYGYEPDGHDVRGRSPIRSDQIRIDRSGKKGTPLSDRPNSPTISNVGLIGKIKNYITRRNKPEVLQLKVADKLGDGKRTMVPSKTTDPDEHTISRTQANTALRNARAFEKQKIGTVRNPSGTRRSFVGSEVRVPLTVPRKN